MLMSWYISGFHTGNFTVLYIRKDILINNLYSRKRKRKNSLLKFYDFVYRLLSWYEASESEWTEEKELLIVRHGISVYFSTELNGTRITYCIILLYIICKFVYQKTEHFVNTYKDTYSFVSVLLASIYISAFSARIDIKGPTACVHVLRKRKLPIYSRLNIFFRVSFIH